MYVCTYTVICSSMYINTGWYEEHSKYIHCDMLIIEIILWLNLSQLTILKEENVWLFSYYMYHMKKEEHVCFARLITRYFSDIDSKIVKL
jgi:hypothetical protein